MYTNVPTPTLYRVAELQRHEALKIAAERRGSTFLAPSPHRIIRLRMRLGSALVAIGNWIAPELPLDVRRATTG